MLRGADFPITVSETLDALRPIRVIGIDPAAFHDGLAATLVKDEADRPYFDARNNRRPPRADILGRMRGAVRCLVWLNPEPGVRWNTGDSVMHTYQRHCEAVLAGSTIRELHAALRHSFTTR